MPFSRVRVVGSGFTSFNYQGKPIAFLEDLRDSGQAPGVGPESITPLGARHPIEIVTPRYLAMGTLTMTIRELWDEPVWWQLTGLGQTNDIISVFEVLAQEPSEVTAQLIIKPPGSNVWRGKTYHGVVITGIDDSETVNIGALSVPRTLTAAYTHTTPLRETATA